MTRRRISWLAAFLCSVTGVAFLGGEVYMKSKGLLAARLIDRACDAWLDDGQQRPAWPWADFRALARLEVPRLGVRRTILSGASGSSLAFGLGHVSGTAPPGTGGNSAIAGHRDSWGSFIGDLRAGDELRLRNRGGWRRYRVIGSRVVDDHDIEPLAPATSSRLTLITCYPVGGLLPTGLRLVVQAEPLGE